MHISATGRLAGLSRSALLSILALLLSGAPLAAQVAVGAEAPEIPRSAWIQEPERETLAELRGRVVILYFFWTDVFGARGVKQPDGSLFVYPLEPDPRGSPPEVPDALQLRRA